MRNQILKFKALLFIAVMAVSIHACSDDNEDEKSFLEAHGGSFWKFGEPEVGLTIYAQINNSESNPFEIWLYDVIDECYLYEKISNEGSPEVLENRENKVQIRIGDETGDYGILTMTVSGDILRVELDSYEDGQMVEDEKFILNRTTDNPNDLNVCD